MYEAQTDELVQVLLRVLHCLPDLKQFLFDCFCPTRVRDGHPDVQTHAIPNSLSDNSSSDSMSRVQAS